MGWVGARSRSASVTGAAQSADDAHSQVLREHREHPSHHSAALETAASDAPGFGKYTAGPACALFGQNEPWNGSVIVTQEWSYAGGDDRDDVSLFRLRPSLNYNLKNG